MISSQTKIYVAGHTGLVGSAIVRGLKRHGFNHLVLRTRKELDLMDAGTVEDFFKSEKPEVVILAAAKVGGIHANATYPTEFLYENLTIQNNVIMNAFRCGTKRLAFLGSSCIYPKECAQPIKEEYLLMGPLETTNDAYALAKIAGVHLCKSLRKQYGVAFHSIMPTNMFGIGDSYHLENSHVLPALIRKFHEAKFGGKKEVVVWGSGKPKRDLLLSDELAEAIILMLNIDNPPDLVNVGSGKEYSILELAEAVKKIVGYDGEIVFDSHYPDGTLRKIVDISKIQALGWKPKLSLEAGLQIAYADFQARLTEFAS
jgi:GDP-L-fucose synthase